MEFRARFAPSPTGQVHIGNIRTAIFNWLATRHNKGTFLLRIEDTDLERSTQDAIDKLLDCMKWLGLDYDEEIMYQTRQSDLHKQAAKKLVEQGSAYPLDPAEEHSPILFRLPYECDGMKFVRQVGRVRLELASGSAVQLNQAGVVYQTVSPKGKTVENAAALAGFKDLEILGADGSVLFRLDETTRGQLPSNPQEKMTVENAAALSFVRREVFYHDLVKGDLAKPLDSMKDFIIVRSDGSPVFHLANVYDDMQQRVTHIVRGDDHVENTYRHLFLFEALGFTPPQYAHLPMIVNKAGKPYSKRDGDAFVGDFREKGFLPQALFNYLSLLGWSPGDGREKMSKEELVEAFTIERALRSPAQFDMAKLTNMNALYIAELPEEEFRRAIGPYLEKFCPEAVGSPLLDQVAALMHSRTKTFADVAHWNYFFRSAEKLEYDAKALKKFLSDDMIRRSVSEFAEILETLPERCSAAEIESKIRAVEEKYGIPQGKLNQPLRIAVTGSTIGAGIYETIELIGSAESALRIRKALERKAE